MRNDADSLYFFLLFKGKQYCFLLSVYVSQTLKPFANIEMIQKAREYLLTLYENAVFANRTLQN